MFQLKVFSLRVLPYNYMSKALGEEPCFQIWYYRPAIRSFWVLFLLQILATQVSLLFCGRPDLAVRAFQLDIIFGFRWLKMWVIGTTWAADLSGNLHLCSSQRLNGFIPFFELSMNFTKCGTMCKWFKLLRRPESL